MRSFIGCVMAFCWLVVSGQACAERVTGEVPMGTSLVLNGVWEVAEGSWDEPPGEFSGTCPVPGIIKNASPLFEDLGEASERREAFWYRRQFELREDLEFEVGRLIIKKAKYGNRVYLNGVEVGGNDLNFTSTVLDVTDALIPGGLNELVIGVGAHIENGFPGVCTGGEVEKERYYAGIYDDVKLVLSRSTYVSNVQVAPDLATMQVRVQVEFENAGEEDREVVFTARVHGPDHEGRVAESYPVIMTVPGGGRSQQDVVMAVPGARLWTPEKPYLYTLEIAGGTESYWTRFGMRSFAVDPRFMNRALLNGQRYFLRGTNVALFRFFEDPRCEQQPWDRAWVEALFDTFKSFHWNAIRPNISAFPDFWYDLADEKGIILFDEYPMWYALQNDILDEETRRTNTADPVRKYGIYPEDLTADQLVREYRAWMREHWNHASVCAWDAQNETWTPQTGEAVRRVRHLDLSNRPWDNGWSPPVQVGDYREGHNYYAAFNVGSEEENPRGYVPEPFKLSDLPGKDRIGFTFYAPYQGRYENRQYDDYWQFPCVLNEYGYFWLNRDGSPTTLTKPYYDAVLGPHASAGDRFYHYARMLAALTEFWRMSRTYFGVLHVFGLSFSSEYAATGDMFVDVNSLELFPGFGSYVRDAFAPVGICLDFWDEEMPRHSAGWPPIKGFEVPVWITNDRPEGREGTFVIRLIGQEKGASSAEAVYPFEVAAWGQDRVFAKLPTPRVSGHYQLQAELRVENAAEPVVTSYRDVLFTD